MERKTDHATLLTAQVRPVREHDADRPRVVEFIHSCRELDDIDAARDQAEHDFSTHFEKSRERSGLEIWGAYSAARNDRFIGWSGLLHTDLTNQYGDPELQFMIAGNGQDYATELTSAVPEHTRATHDLPAVIATVDIPNRGSIGFLEKLGFDFDRQIEAYGSPEMFLYCKSLKQGMDGTPQYQAKPATEE